MAGSHNATTPYYTITPRGVGPVVGFWVGFSLGTCCMVGYDWDRPSPAYSYQIQFIHIKGVWHTLYVVGSHMTVSVLYCHHNTIALAMFGGGECVDFWHVSYCYVMIGSSHPLNTHTRSTSYKYKALAILYMRWAVIWVCPYSITISSQ